MEGAVGTGPLRELPEHTRPFVALWALAEIAHLAILARDDLSRPTGMIALATAFWLLADLSSWLRLAALGVAQIVAAIDVSPLAADHQVLAALVNLGIILATLNSSIRGVGLALPERAIRATFLVCYGAAALSKYNSTFLDPLTSCATFIAESATFGLLQPTQPVAWIPVALAVASETGVLVMLAVPRLRRYGALLAILFHGTVAASPAVAVEDFTLTVFAGVMLFVARRTRVRLSRTVAADLRRSFFYPMWSRIGTPGVRSLVVCASTIALHRSAPLVLALLVWLVCLATTAVLFIAVSRTNTDEPAMARTRASWLPLAIVPLALFIVASPYLGARTTGVFTMFSNLRTEAGETNHYFIPILPVFSYQDDLVILDSEFLGAPAGSAIPVIEAVRVLHDDPEVILSGTYREGPLRPTEIAAPSFGERKFLHFRAVNLEAPACTN